jgi:hypothetical protein
MGVKNMSKTFVRGDLKHGFLSAALGITVGGAFVVDAALSGGMIMGSTLAAKAAGSTFGVMAGYFTERGVAYGLHGVGIDESDISIHVEAECNCDKPDCCVAKGVETIQKLHFK